MSNPPPQTAKLVLPEANTEPDGEGNSDGDYNINQIPVLCSFPGGLPAQLKRAITEGTTDMDEEDSLEFQWKTDEKSRERSLVGKDESCRYRAMEPLSSEPPALAAGANALSNTSRAPTPKRRIPSTRMVIGLYDKQKRTVTMHEVGFGGNVLPMSQSVLGYKGANDSDPHEDPSPARQSLFADFGSAKKRRVMKSQEANRVDVNMVVGSGSAVKDAVLNNAGMSESNKRAIEEQREHEEAGGDEEAASSSRQTSTVVVATEKWRKEFFPSFNLKATHASECYNAIEMVGGEGLWKHFGHIIDKVMKTDDIVSAMVDGPPRKSHSDDAEGENDDTSVVSRRSLRDAKSNWKPSMIELLRRINSKNSNKTILKKNLICAYALHYMLHLYALHSRNFNIPSVDPQRHRYFTTPLPFGRFWLKTFTSEAIRTRNDGSVVTHMMSKSDKDKCSLYMLLLLLSADSGKSMHCSDIQPFLDDSGIDFTTAQNLLRLAGCSVARNIKTGNVVVTLDAPLKFPEPSGRRARRSK